MMMNRMKSSAKPPGGTQTWVLESGETSASSTILYSSKSSPAFSARTTTTGTNSSSSYTSTRSASTRATQASSPPVVSTISSQDTERTVVYYAANKPHKAEGSQTIRELHIPANRKDESKLQGKLRITRNSVRAATAPPAPHYTRSSAKYQATRFDGGENLLVLTTPSAATSSSTSSYSRAADPYDLMNGILAKQRLRQARPATAVGKESSKAQVVSFEEKSRPRRESKLHSKEDDKGKRGVAFISTTTAGSPENKTHDNGVTASEKKVTDLARELWNFDTKHARLARDLQRYLQGAAVEDPVSLAEYLKSKMGLMDFEEAKKKEKDKARNEAEILRRKKQDADRDKEQAATELRTKNGVEQEMGRRIALEKRRQEAAVKEDVALKRKQEVENLRVERLRRDLVEQEDERIKLVDETSRAREVQRRIDAAALQERQHQELCERDEVKRERRKAWEQEHQHDKERRDPQVVRASPGHPALMQGHPKMIAPYAMQQRPMLARLNRWKHPDDAQPDYKCIGKPLHDQAFRLVREEVKPLRPQTRSAPRAYDRGNCVSRKWEAITPR
jgi:hypothetical protein